MTRVEMQNDGPTQSRRTFLRGTLAGSAMLLGGCSLPFQVNNAPTPIVKEPVTLNWICETGFKSDIKSFEMLARMYNTLNHDQITVNVHPGTAYDTLQQMLTSQNPADRVQYDILSLDVVWMSEFASKNWIIPLDRYWPNWRSKATTTSYLQAPFQAASYHGQLWGAPLHTDVGILYYRKDMVGSEPNIKSWDDLERMALEAQSQKGLRWGFTWQAQPFDGNGKVNEAMICNLVEILSGYGGKIFDDAHNPAQVLIDSSEARKALSKMKSWLQTISPDVTNNDEGRSTLQWKTGQAVFMRNWPAAVVDSLDHSSSQVFDKFDIITLPFSTDSHTGGGCLGGYQLAINYFSSIEKRDAAWKFIWWMLQHDAQHYLAVQENFPVTLAEIYDDDEIKNRNPYYNRVKNYVNNAQFRPVLPHYQCATKAIATMIKNIFNDQTTSDEALPLLKGQLQSILALKPSDPCPSP